MLTWEVVWGEWVEGDYCLNPYSNGMLTWFLCLHVERLKHGCLNPYSNGMLTWFTFTTDNGNLSFCLNPYSNGMLTWLL